MPTIETYRDHLIRSDYGMLLLVALTTFIVGGLILLYRKWATAPGMILDTEEEVQTVFPRSLARLNLPRLNIVAVLIVGLLLRLPLMTQAFWYDEAFTQRITTLSLDQLPAAIMADTHPPLFYSLIWLWSRLVGSHSELLLRIPSLVCGLLLIYLLYRLVKAAGLSEATALIAALLCAVTPASLYYGTELRNYAMLTCAVFGSLLCILEDRPKGFVLCTMLVGWLHNLGLLYVPFLCLAAAFFHATRLITRGSIDFENPLPYVPKHWLVSVLIAVVLASVWLPLTLQQSQSVSDGFWIYFNAGVPAWLFTLNLMYVPMELIFPLLLPYIGLLLIGFYGARAFLCSLPGKLLLLVMVGVPVLAILISLVWAPVFLPRTFLPITLLALIPLAESIQRERVGLGLGAITLSCAALVVFYGSAAPLLKPDYRAMMETSCAGTTALYATAIDTAITVAPYWSGDMLVWEESSDRGGTFKPGQLPLYGFHAGEISQLSGQTVCMVYIFTPRTLQTEREKVTQITLSYPSTVDHYAIHEELEVDIFKVEVR